MKVKKVFSNLQRQYDAMKNDYFKYISHPLKSLPNDSSRLAAGFMPANYVIFFKRCPVLAAVAAMFFITILPVRAEDPSPRERLLLDFGWKFHLGDDWGMSQRLDKAGVNPGPAGRTFSDANWRVVNLPHDWLPELPFDSHSNPDHGFKPFGPGYLSN